MHLSKSNPLIVNIRNPPLGMGHGSSGIAGSYSTTRLVRRKILFNSWRVDRCIDGETDTYFVSSNKGTLYAVFPLACWSIQPLPLYRLTKAGKNQRPYRSGHWEVNRRWTSMIFPPIYSTFNIPVYAPMWVSMNSARFRSTFSLSVTLTSQ